MTYEDAEVREQSRAMSARIREAAGFAGGQKDTNGAVVRDERGRFVQPAAPTTGLRLDNGSRGGEAPREHEHDMNKAMREALGMATE